MLLVPLILFGGVLLRSTYLKWKKRNEDEMFLLMMSYGVVVKGDDAWIPRWTRFYLETCHKAEQAQRDVGSGTRSGSETMS